MTLVADQNSLDAGCLPVNYLAFECILSPDWQRDLVDLTRQRCKNSMYLPPAGY
jgi:hypothetical protein